MSYFLEQNRASTLFESRRKWHTRGWWRRKKFAVGTTTWYLRLARSRVRIVHLGWLDVWFSIR